MNKDTSIYQLVGAHLNNQGQQVVTVRVKGILKGVFTIAASKLVTDEKAMLAGFSSTDIVSIVGLLATEKQVLVTQTSRLGRFKFLPMLAMLFITCMAVAAISSIKLISLFDFTLVGGVFVIPVSYFISSIVTEIYGYKHVRQLIWSGLFCSLLMIALLQVTILLPSSEIWSNQNEFAQTLNAIPRLLIATWSGYIVGEFLSSFCLARFKLGKVKLVLRVIFAVAIGHLIETILFVMIAYYGKISNLELGTLIINVVLLKYMIALLLMPSFVYITKWVKKIEDVDIVDIATNFTPFSLDINYDISNNLSRTIH